MLPFVVIPFVPCIPGFPKPWSINWSQVGDIHSIFPAKCNTTCTYSGNMKIMRNHRFWGLPYCLFHFDMTVLKKIRFLPGWIEKTPQQPPPTNSKKKRRCDRPATAWQVHHAIAETLPQHREKSKQIFGHMLNWAIYYKSLTWMFRPFWVGFPENILQSLPFGVTILGGERSL